MDSAAAIAALSALAHEHRLAVYRLLIEHGPAGLPAGTIGAQLGLAPSSLTFHLQSLARAGLLLPRRQSRQIFYAADFAVMNALVGYLTENCCGVGGTGGAACLTECRSDNVASQRPARKQNG